MPVLTNQRHEMFAQNRLKGMTIDGAYAEAGFKPHSGNAARLSGNESVRSRVAELQGEAAKEAVVTAADIARQLDEDRAFARLMESPSAMVAASMGKAKVLGLIVDRSELTGRNGGPIQTEERATSTLIEEAKRLGIDPAALGING